MILQWVTILLRYALLWPGVIAPVMAGEVHLPSPYGFSQLVINQNTITYQACGLPVDTAVSVPIEPEDAKLLSDIATGWEKGDLPQQIQSVARLAKWVQNQPVEETQAILAISLVWMYFSVYQYPEAERVFSELSAAAKRRVTPEIHIVLGEISLIKGELDASQQSLEHVSLFALEACNAMHLKYAVLQSELAIHSGQLTEANQRLEQAQIYEDKIGFSKDALPLLVNLYDTFGFLYLARSRVEPALQQLLMKDALNAESKALDFAIKGLKAGNESEPLHKQHLVVLSNLAWIYTQLYDYHNAEVKLLTALGLLQDKPDRDLENHIYFLLGVNYLSVGLYEKSHVFLVNAARIASHSDPLQFARIHCLLTNVASEGDIHDSLPLYLSECSKLAAYKGALSEDKILSLSAQLNAFVKASQVPAQHQHIAKMLETELFASNHENFKMSGYTVLAEWAFSTKNYAMATRAAGAMIFDETLISPTIQVKARLLKYCFLTLNGPTLEAFDFAENTHQFIYSLLSKLDAQEMAPALQNQIFGFYQLWFEHLMQTQQAENTRKVLQISMQLNQLTNGVTNTLNTYGGRDLTHVSELQAEVLDSNSAQASLTHHIVWDLERLAYAKQGLPATSAVEYGSSDLPESVSIEAVQARLKPFEQLWFYVAGETTGYVFGVTQDSVETASLGDLSELQQVLRNMHSAISQRQPIEDSALTLLAERIFPQKLASGDRPMWYVVTNQVFQDMPVNGLALSLRKPPESVIKVLSLAAPQINDVQQNRPAFRLLSVPELIVNSSQDMPIWMADLQPLPWSAIEAEKLTGLFEASDARALVGESASRDALFSEEARTSAVLHIAAHHIYDPFKPQYVGLVLNAQSQSSMGSAFISEFEIRNQQFFNELVFLNGCATAQGRHFTGSNTMSITRAFLIGGAKKVLSTLWEVADRASLTFASAYYEAYLRTGDTNKALIHTMQGMRSQPRYRHPFYWAGYELTQRHL